MIQIVYSPQWFYGKDIIIDVISTFVLFLIAMTSLRYHKLNKNKNYLYLAMSFGMIGASFLFKILTNFTIYYHVVESRNFGFATFTFQTMRSSDTLFFIAYLAYRLLMLFGLYFLYSIYTRQAPTTSILIVFLILALTYFSHSAYYIFHLTSLILLIIISYQYYKNCRKTKHKTAKLLFLSFSIISIGHIISLFISYNALHYVIAEIIQLIGYVLLLVTFIMVLKYGKEKK